MDGFLTWEMFVDCRLYAWEPGWFPLMGGVYFIQNKFGRNDPYIVMQEAFIAKFARPSRAESIANNTKEN